MIRINAQALSGAFVLLFILLCGTVTATAQTSSDKAKASKASAKKPDTSKADKKAAKGSAKPVLLANYGDWGAFLAQVGKDKTCYALASPKERMPAALQRDPAYVFISNRPAENVRNEISIIMGFPMKDGSAGRAEVGSAGFDLVAKGPNAWVKNPAEEAQFIDVMKKSAKLVIKASSIKGNTTTDSYSLTGFSQALDRVLKECP